MSHLARITRLISPQPPAVGAHRRAAGAIGATLSRVGMLACDSREGLRSHEQQLAAHGVRWSMDLAYETELAQELAIARQRRLARVFEAPAAATPVASSAEAGEVVAAPAPLVL